MEFEGVKKTIVSGGERVKLLNPQILSLLYSHRTMFYENLGLLRSPCIKGKAFFLMLALGNNMQKAPSGHLQRRTVI